MNWTPATPISLPRALFAASPKTEAAFSAPFWCSASPLDATFPDPLVCVANKELRVGVSPLNATLTKNRGVGPVMVNQTSKSLLPGPGRGACAAEHISPATDRLPAAFLTFGLRPRVGREEANGQIARGPQACRRVKNYGNRVHHHRGSGDVAMRAARNHQADIRMAHERN